MRKAVIPAAGRGTRLGDLTLTQPKELLPIVDKVALDYIIEEALGAGIEEICLITSAEKVLSFEKHLRKHRVQIDYLIQHKPLGLGHALSVAEDWVGSDDFLLMLPDELYLSVETSEGLIKYFDKVRKNVVTVFPVNQSQISSYGIPEIEIVGAESKVLRIMEKPEAVEPTLNKAIAGRYLLSKNIWGALKRVPPSINGEIELTTALNFIANENDLLAYEIKGTRFDIGSKKGWLEANLLLAKNKYGERWLGSLLK